MTTAPPSGTIDERCVALYASVEELRRVCTGWTPHEGRTSEQKSAHYLWTKAAVLFEVKVLSSQPDGAVELAACAAALDAYLKVSEPALPACLGPVPDAVAQARAGCRGAIDTCQEVLLAEAADYQSYKQSPQTPNPTPGREDRVRILEEFADACSKAVATLSLACTEAVNKTTETCDKMLANTAAQLTSVQTAGPASPADGAAAQSANASPGGPEQASYSADDKITNVLPASPAHTSYDADDQRPNVPPANPAYVIDGKQQNLTYPPPVATADVQPVLMLAGKFEMLLAEPTKQPSAEQAIDQPPQQSRMTSATALFFAKLDKAYHDFTWQVLGRLPANLGTLDLGQIEAAWNVAMAESLRTVRRSGSQYTGHDAIELFRINVKLRGERARQASLTGRR